jgi:hypothetical protein
MTIEDMIAELSGRYPGFFRDADGIDANVATYRRTLGHLTGEQLEAAFTETMRSYEDRFAPPLPKDILANVRAAKSASNFNMKAMCEALPAIEARIRKSYNDRCGDKAREMVRAVREANPGHEEAAEKEFRGNLAAKLSAKIHTHAQLVYRGKETVESFELTEQELPHRGELNPYTLAIREGREPPKLRRIG